MPTTIDTENAKQIREPMEVYVALDARDGKTLTYSGYSSTAKVADGALGNTQAMRALTDLQGDGFPLDGSCLLYRANQTSPGKIGVRGNIGQAVNVIASASSAIGVLSVYATGAKSVSYGGESYQMAAGYATIPIGSTSAALTFEPLRSEERAEISLVTSGVYLNATNENIISCIVSLRADLSILDPTLPESELNVEVYNDADIGEYLASVPEETPITYQAGYGDDLSPLRRFYISGQITYKDNVISIHAVDAVHWMDEELPTNVSLTTYAQSQSGDLTPVWRASLSCIYRFLHYLVGSSGITIADYYSTRIDRGPGSTGYSDALLVNASRKRDVVAGIMNLFHRDYPAGFFYDGIASFWPVFVDAGIPSIALEKPSSTHDIYEEDCGEVKRNTERFITKIVLTYSSISEQEYYNDTAEVGSARWLYKSGAFLNFDEEYVRGYTVDASSGSTTRNIRPTYDGVANSNYGGAGKVSYGDGTRETNARFLIKNDVPKGILIGAGGSAEGHLLNSQVIPWSTSQASVWSTLYGTDHTDKDAVINGSFFSTQKDILSYGSAGNTADVENDMFVGRVRTRSVADSGMVTAFPDGAYQSLLSRSPVTGSFTWKGDPRMQPRDVFTFHRLDGTTEDCTIESITLTHKGGGLSAEITYRKGVC